MGTRSFAQVAPTPATIALNAYIYGYGGHSLVTPHAALKQLWWTDERIQAKITQQFVVSKLRGEERDWLNMSVGLGEELTDDTYLEWIINKAKRMFLILAEVGVPDQIFGVIDDLWSDDDLPILGMDGIRSLDLAIENDEALNQRFYNAQFLYLLRGLKQGSHIDYGPKEHIPMEYVSTLPPAVNLQTWDRVHFPGRPNETYMRRKYSLTDKETGNDLRKNFIRDVRKGQLFAHEHVAPVWASYTSDNAGYIVSDFVGEHTLGTFIDHRNPMQFQRVPAEARPVLLCEWMHCLSDALASLHHRGAAHTAIRPSNIIIDRDNRIAFADVGSIRTLQVGKKVNKTEIYDYAAPQSPLAQPPISLASSPPISSAGAFSKIRKLSSSNSSSSGGSSNGGSTRSNSMCTAPTSPATSQYPGRTSSFATITTTISSPSKSFGGFRNFSRHLPHTSLASTMSDASVPPSPTTIIHLVPTTSSVESDVVNDISEPSPELADVYSLGCVFLDIVTFMLKGKLNDFVKYRTSRIQPPLPNQKRARNDTSFHASPDKIDAWIDMLQDDSLRMPGDIYKALPALLELLRSMLAHQDTLRPSSIEVRDRIQEILVDQGGVNRLCCIGREWHALIVADDAVDTSEKYFQEAEAAAAAAEAHAAEVGSHFDADGSILDRSESKGGGSRSRRRSSAASAATAKINTWRRKFSRS